MRCQRDRQVTFHCNRPRGLSLFFSHNKQCLSRSKRLLLRHSFMVGLLIRNRVPFGILAWRGLNGHSRAHHLPVDWRVLATFQKDGLDVETHLINVLT